MAENVEKIEVVEVPATTIINSQGFLCRTRTQQKCDSHYVEQFIEIPPLAYDEKTGEVLNKTLVPILKEVEPFNFYEKIQSFKDDCDIYSILAKFQKTNDISLLNQGHKTFVDLYHVPDNINDFDNLMKKVNVEVKKYSSEQIEAIKSGKNEEINGLVQDLVKAELIKQGVIKKKVDLKTEDVKKDE